MGGRRQSLLTVVLLSACLLFQSICMAVNTNAANTSQKFTDINGHWAEKQILALVESGIVKGKPDGNKLKINPNDYITRAEFITLLTQGLKLTKNTSKVKKFSDVKSTMWYSNAIDTAVSNEITSGYPDNTFKPENPVTRAELATFLAKALELKQDFSGVSPKPYKDVTSKEWFFGAVAACNEAGLVNGYSDGNFLPKNKATRAEAFVVMYNIQNNKEFAGKIKKEGAVITAVTEVKTNLSASTATPVVTGNLTDYSRLTATPDLPKTTATPDVPKTTATPDVPKVTATPSNEKPEPNLKPVITLESPFKSNNKYLETKDGQVKIKGTVYGNKVQEFYYTIDNDNGTGKKIRKVEKGVPETKSVAKDVYTEKLEWNINLNPLEKDLNIINLTFKDVYGNEASQKMEIMSFADNDGDGISNYDERSWGLNPDLADTDGDGLNDYVEIKETFTNALKKDTDGDGISDYDEVVTFKWKISPTLFSTVGYGINDAELDLDGDGLSNVDEINKYKTDPTKLDTDGDGLPDGVEVLDYGTDPKKIDSNFNRVITRLKKELPTNKTGLYGLPDFVDLDINPLTPGDKRVQVVLKVQYLLNRLLDDEGKSSKTVKYTGEFDSDTKDALFEVFALNEVNKAAYDELVKRVKKIREPVDELKNDRSYIGYDITNQGPEGVKEFKYILENWKQTNSSSFKALYTIPSLLESDGTMSGLFDNSTVAMLKLFQQHNGLKPTGKINDATAKLLLSSMSDWKIDYALIKDDMFQKESFGKNSFYRYASEAKIALEPVYYSQLYGPWSKEPYYAVKRGYAQNGRIIQRNGCGPTSTAMVIATLADKSVDPATMARFSMENDCIAGYDTEGTLYPKAAKAYGLNYEYTTKIDRVKEYLKGGKHLAIASMNRGHFTGGGHLIALMGTIKLPGEDFDRIIVYDANTGNESYGSDNSVILSRIPGIVYSKTDILQKEQAIGFWLIWK